MHGLLHQSHMAPRLQIVTLRTMKNTLTSMLARLHDASRALRITPAFKDFGDNSSDDSAAAPAAAAAAGSAIAAGNGSDDASDDESASDAAGSHRWRSAHASQSGHRGTSRHGGGYRGGGYGDTGPVEQEEGSTARAVAAAVEMFAGELLDAAEELQRLQKQLDSQHEGCVPPSSALVSFLLCVPVCWSLPRLQRCSTASMKGANTTCLISRAARALAVLS